MTDRDGQIQISLVSPEKDIEIATGALYDPKELHVRMVLKHA